MLVVVGLPVSSCSFLVVVANLWSAGRAEAGNVQELQVPFCLVPHISGHVLH